MVPVAGTLDHALQGNIRYAILSALGDISLGAGTLASGTSRVAIAARSAAFGAEGILSANSLGEGVYLIYQGDSIGAAGRFGDAALQLLGLSATYRNIKFANPVAVSVEQTAKNITTAGSVSDKLKRYLLNPNHPVGGDKAKWFSQALGFTQENLDVLASQIVFDPSKAIQIAVTDHGTKYNQLIEIIGANGKHIEVNFAWIRNNDGIVRLVTAIPTKK